MYRYLYITVTVRIIFLKAKVMISYKLRSIRHVVYEETIEVVREPCPTESEADVKADRGEYS